MAFRIAFVPLLLTLTACNGDQPTSASTADNPQGRWIGTGGPCEDMDMLKQNEDARESVGMMTCGNAGLTFNGELRCERNYIEVFCR